MCEQLLPLETKGFVQNRNCSFIKGLRLDPLLYVQTKSSHRTTSVGVDKGLPYSHFCTYRQRKIYPRATSVRVDKGLAQSHFCPRRQSPSQEPLLSVQTKVYPIATSVLVDRPRLEPLLQTKSQSIATSVCVDKSLS